MWPRLLAQLLELLPHVSRLVPLADRYFATRSAREQAQDQAQAQAQEQAQQATRAALDDLAATLRSDLTALAQSHTSLMVQLEGQAAQLARVRVQMEALTQQVKRLHAWLIGSAILGGVLLLSILALLLLHCRPA